MQAVNGHAFASQRTCDLMRSHLPSAWNAPAILIGYSRWKKWKYPIKMSDKGFFKNLFVHYRKTLCLIWKRTFSAARKMTFWYWIRIIAYTLLRVSVTDTHRHWVSVVICNIFSYLHQDTDTLSKKGRHHFFVTDDTWIQIFIIHTMKRNTEIWPSPQFGYANSHRDFQCKVWIFGGLLLNSPFHCKTDYD